VRDFNPVVFAIGRRRKKVVGIAFLILLILSGCASVVKNPTPITSPGVQTAYPHTEQEYRLQIGDQLDVKFFYNPELNEQVTVRPDGRISLQLVHEIIAVGLTPQELTDLLTKKYAPELKKPEITVIVRSFSAQKIYVDGEVTKPGMVPLIGFMSVLQAISQAGGMKDSARTSEVVIIRRGENHNPLVGKVNLDKAIDGTDMSQDIVLKPFDIVFVPKSPIANVNVWVDQYVRKNLPIYLSFGYFFP
jgi:protein involved in polysaccharide export with SLBB domain